MFPTSARRIIIGSTVKKRFITPEGQRYIRHIFTQNGITDALQFESYSEVYKW
ncbi:MAG: DUF6078 family protein [Bacteroides cellulosilyticus]